MKLIQPSDIIADAKAAITEMDAERRDDVSIGLRSRFPRLNAGIKKHFRFGNIYALAGNSGGGKSYMANMLRTDLTDLEPLVVDINGINAHVINHVITHGQFNLDGDKLVRQPINADFKGKVLNLHFGYEMHNKWEFIRTVTTMTAYSFDYLLSSKTLGELPNGEFQYNKLTDDELALTTRVLKAYIRQRHPKNGGRVIMYTFGTPGTLNEFAATIYKYAKMYPDYQIVVTNDHTLLHRKGDGVYTDQEMVDESIKVFIEIRDRTGALFLPIVQTNSEMEKDDRVINPQLHYPTKKDIYRGGQFYQGCDFVMVQVMPEVFRIENYGPNGYNTENLIHLSLIKTRMGKPAHLWFTNRLDKGRFITSLPNDVTGELDVLTNLMGY